MVINNLIFKIENSMQKFSKGQKLIADYLVHNYDKAAFMTASKLGKTVGVSESTVVRFAYEIGYDGYPKLQKDIREIIRNKLNSIQRFEVTEKRIGNEDLLNSVLTQDIEKIKTTLSEVSHKDFYAAVETIVNSDRIYILAARSSAPLADFLGFYFNLIFENVFVIRATSEAEMYEKLFRISKGDVIIGISFPRYSSVVAKSIKFASDRGASVITMTDCMGSPVVSLSDYVILSRSDMVSIVDSLVAPLSMINALIVAVALKKKDELINTLGELEDFWDRYGVYEKSGGENIEH